jgi:phage/plasmid-like protein (TIGR03299 family)
MSHEISIINGYAEAAFANRPAWHNLGQIHDEGGTSGMKLNHLEQLVPTVMATRHKVPLFLADGIQIDGHYAVQNELTKAVHGIVGSRYVIYQVREAVAFLDSLVESGEVEIETCFAMFDGATVVIQARLPHGYSIGNDKTVSYMAFMIPFTGTKCLEAIASDVRTVCANTLSLSRRLGKVHKIRHTAAMHDRLAAFRSYMLDLQHIMQERAADAEMLANVKIDEKQTETFLKRVLEPNARQLETLSKAWWQEFRDFNRIGEQGLIETAWHTLQTVTRAVDHLGYESRRGGSDRVKAERTFESTWSGTGDILKNNVRGELIEMLTGNV